MKRSAFLLLALVLAGSALVASDQFAGAAPEPKAYVVVDPMDLRKPVPDPEQGLTQKYDDKLVRFTGVLGRVTQSKKTKKYSYELHYNIVAKVPAKGKKLPTLQKETIVVPVSFQTDPKQLHTSKPGLPLTVQGRGSVTTDGTLIISNAVIVPPQQLFKK
jgi:hypothetical protein